MEWCGEGWGCGGVVVSSSFWLNSAGAGVSADPPFSLRRPRCPGKRWKGRARPAYDATPVVARHRSPSGPCWKRRCRRRSSSIGKGLLERRGAHDANSRKPTQTIWSLSERRNSSRRIGWTAMTPTVSQPALALGGYRHHRLQSRLSTPRARRRQGQQRQL